jgi:hypothetical protein
MERQYDFMTPLSRAYLANQASVISLSSTRKFDGGALVVTELASGGVSILSRLMSALAQHKREERKLASQLRGVGHAIETDIRAKINYGINMLLRLKEFYEFLDYSVKHPNGAFIFELADRIKSILELDDSFEYSKSSAVWDSQKDFLFKNAKQYVVHRVAAFYNMVRPKIVQIDQEKNNVFQHFMAFLKDLENGVEKKADAPSAHALYRIKKTLDSLEKLAALYIEVTLLSLTCLTG